MAEPVVLRVKLPPSSPVIHKTIKLPPSNTVKGATDHIGKTLMQTLSVNSNYGLYLPNQQKWLAEDETLAQVQDAISHEEYVELRDREVVKKTNKILLGAELTYGLIGFLVGVISTAVAFKMYKF